MRLIVAIVGICFFVEARSVATEVNWEEDTYQVVLWKLFHKFEALQGETWPPFDAVGVVADLGLKELGVSRGQYTSEYKYSLSGRKLADIRIPHSLFVNICVKNETNAIDHVFVGLTASWDPPLGFADFERFFGEHDMLGRLSRLGRFRTDVGKERIQSLMVTFRDLRNRHSDWACNGFVIDIELVQRKGEDWSQTITYYVGTALDPFIDRSGKVRDRDFRGKDDLVDPEWGPDCEMEATGVRVFLKL